MKCFCEKCQNLVEVKLEEKTTLYTIHGQTITYEKLIPRCPFCNSVLDIESINEENANRVLEEFNYFSDLNPFCDE